MSSQWWSTEERPESRVESPEQRLTVELEPTKDGGQRALLYPIDSPGHEVATNWLAAAADSLVDLDDVR